MGLWIGSALLARFLVELWHLNFFKLAAWVVLIRLLASSAELGRARASDLGVFLVCALCVLLPGDDAVWVASTLAAIYFWLTRNGDPYRASAAVLLTALAVNGLWGILLFNFFALWLLDFDTWLVAKALQAAGVLVTVHANQLIVGRGDLEIFGQCSSYHDISLALLVWLTVTKFVRPTWARTDVLFALACVAITLAWNTLRLIILAKTTTNPSAFYFWHLGAGAQVFVTALAFIVAIVAAAGASRAPA